MSAASIRSLVTRRNVIAFVILEVILFVVANATANSSSHPGTLSNIAFVTFLVGILVLIVGGAAAGIRALRAAR
jgi:hypothetical protein